MQQLDNDKLNKINILGVWVNSLTLEQLHQLVVGFVHKKHHALVLHVNAHCLNLAYHHKWLRDYLNQAEVVFADGIGVILAAQLWGQHIPTRITYADWTWQLAHICEKENITLFFLGARPGVAQRAALRLKEYYPNLRVVGTHHGYFQKRVGNPENEAVIQTINAVKPNILLLGFGMPLQEQWLLENWSRIEANIALTGGAVFDYISGELRRGPRWMTDYGLEWLARLVIEPQRLWRRYLLGNPVFLWRVIRHRLGLLHVE